MTPETFRAWRKRLGLRQRQAAEALGVTREQVSRYERGVHPISRTVALACAAVAMGIPPAA